MKLTGESRLAPPKLYGGTTSFHWHEERAVKDRLHRVEAWNKVLAVVAVFGWALAILLLVLR